MNKKDKMMRLNNQAKIDYKIIFPNGEERIESDLSNLITVTLSTIEVPSKPIYFPKNLEFRDPNFVPTGRINYNFMVTLWLLRFFMIGA